VPYLIALPALLVLTVGNGWAFAHTFGVFILLGLPLACISGGWAITITYRVLVSHTVKADGWTKTMLCLAALVTIGDDVSYRNTEHVVNLIRHLVTVEHLAAGRMTGDNDLFEVWEDFFVSHLAEKFVKEIERSHFRVTDCGSAGPPAVAVPADLIRGESVVAIGSGRSHAWCDHDRIVQSPGQECRCERVAKIVIGIAPSTVHHDQRTRNGFVTGFQ